MADTDQNTSGITQESQIDNDVLNGDACIKCGFKCIQGCV
jgi:hypothetical protein